ncbi:MAG: REC domain-containing phosphodiesterase [Pseudomonadales bacterium]|nr:REC domain-containing phosphodiesterase [Pseudomonadales bacterium]
MAAPSSIRLIFANTSENRAQEVDSALRNSGLATHFDICTDLSSIEAKLANENCDLIFCDDLMNQVDQLVPDLRKIHPELPIIVFSGDNASSNHNMELGATDVVCPQDKTRLLHVVRRELRHITERQNLYSTRMALDEAERRCELLLANASAAIAYVHEGMHIHANGTYLKLFGFESIHDLESFPLLDLAHSDSVDELKTQLKSFKSASESVSFEFVGCTQQNEIIPGTMTFSYAEYEGETCTQIIFKSTPQNNSESLATAEDASSSDEQPDSAENFEIASAADSTNDQLIAHLTNAHLTNAPLQALYQLCEGRNSGALLILELDDFDGLQNKHGLLGSQSIADAIYSSLLEDNDIHRLNIHRFALLMEEGSIQAHEKHAEALKQLVSEQTINVSAKTITVTASIGAVELDGQETLPPVETAYYTLLKAKTGTSSNTVVWDNCDEEDDSQLAQKRRQNKEQGRLLQTIDTAISNQKFSLLFQPIISLRGDADEHYEVFLRMQDDEHGNLAPGEFLEAAKENGAAGKIDRWVILQAIKILTEHRAKGHSTRLTINLTYNSVIDPDFLEWLGVAIKAASMPSDALIFQITEADASVYLDKSAEFIDNLRSLHCRTSLGRFGLISEPFDLLNKLKVDFVKLDGSLVNGKDKETFTSIIKELQASGMLSVVPMVESAAVLASLWQAGANYIQGHYLQAPEKEMSYDFSTDD